MNWKLAPSLFYCASLNHDVLTSLQEEQLGRLIDWWRRRLMPVMLTYLTSNDRNFLSSERFFTKKASAFRLKKDISIDILFLQTQQKNNPNFLTGSSCVVEDRFQRPQETKITTLQSCMLQRSKVSVVTAYRDVTVYRAWLFYRDLHYYILWFFTLKRRILVALPAGSSPVEEGCVVIDPGRSSGFSTVCGRSGLSVGWPR